MKQENTIFLKAARDIFRLGYSVKMEAEGSDTAEVMLYGQIVEDGPEWWKWSKEDKSAADFKKAIDEVVAKGAKKLLLRINSPGGVCTESVAMRSILGNAGFDEINIRIEGMCASAATDIATLPGAHVAISEGSEYMIHNPWCITLGNANDLEHTIERLRGIEQMSRGFYVKRTGQSEEQIKEWMDAETWFTAQQAVEYGFADELLEAEVSNEMPAAACATDREMAVMRGLYRSVPQQISLRSNKEEKPMENTKVSNAAPVAGAASEINQIKEEHSMELNENTTVEQLRDANPALLAQVQQDAVAAERERLADIDALTMPGYEEMAAQAKANGTSAMDFQKQVVAAQRKKGADFLSARAEETTPARGVSGGAAGDGEKNEDQEIQENAKAVAEYAKAYARNTGEGMF